MTGLSSDNTGQRANNEAEAPEGSGGASISKSLKMNFNDSVMVKITPDGEMVRDGYYRRLGMEPTRLEKDAQGYTSMQLWEVAHLFGKEMYNGQPRLPVEMAFKLE